MAASMDGSMASTKKRYGDNVKKNKVQKKKSFHTKSKKSAGEKESQEIASLIEKYGEVTPAQLSKFSNFPLSSKTKKGLDKGSYETPTEIQKESILLALQGNDILGAAKTGSGKTLAFLIPVLECLFRKKWNALDGLGALIISPTRELAFQIFEVLRKVGKFHDFSAGLVIGGKHLREESKHINRTNIVICTPGRLLQHMDETANFVADNLQMLVLDEADRILDMGFEQSMNAIISNLPVKRQTLLFSATQTKSVKDLARLSLKDPMYVSVHEKSQHSTPAGLEQSYIVCELHEKLNMLWSFIKNHLKQKTLVFMSCCKQVRYVYEAFCHLRPGVSILALHGGMKQPKRMEAYEQFCRKQNAVLFATDIAARGLDFPEVNWVLQLDCPDEVNTYIHRAGRTARFQQGGEALLVLLPSEEEGMKILFEEKKIPINKIKVNAKKLFSIQKKLESFCASDIRMKDFAQKAFSTYMRSVYLRSNKDVFNVKKIDVEEFAKSLGLAQVPHTRFLYKGMKTHEEQVNTSTQESNEILDMLMRTAKSSKSKPTEQELKLMLQDVGKVSSKRVMAMSSDEEDDEKASESDQEKSSHVEKKGKGHLNFNVEDDDDDGDLLTIKTPAKLEKAGEESTDEEQIEDHTDKSKQQVVSKFKTAKKLMKKNIKVNTRIEYNEEGQELKNILQKPQAELESDDDLSDNAGINIESAKKAIKEEDKIDRQIHRDKVKKRKLEKKIKEKERKRKEREAIEEDEPVAVLGGDDDEQETRVSDSGSESDDDSPPMKKMRESKSGADSSDDLDSDDSGSQKNSLVKMDENESKYSDDSDDYEDSDESDLEDNCENDMTLAEKEALALKMLG